MGLEPRLLKALAHEGYSTPTPIQAQAIPHVLEGRDLLGIAQTGTGKTASFALPILQRLTLNPKKAAPKSARALILSPTRELAAQIADSFKVVPLEELGPGLAVAAAPGGVERLVGLHRGGSIARAAGAGARVRNRVDRVSSCLTTTN